jgi:hypothetical protein
MAARDLYKTAQKAVTNPLGAASDLLGGAVGKVGQALGLSKSEADKRKDRYRQLHADIRAGNWAALKKANASRFAGVRAEAWWALKARDRDAHAAAVYRQEWLGIRRGLPSSAYTKSFTQPTGNFWQRNYQGYTPGAGGPAPSNGGDEWDDTTGPAPGGENGAGSAPPSSPPPPSSGGSAPAAPKPKPKPKPKKKPCPPGSERNPETGRCRKISSSNGGYGIPAPFTGESKPCPAGKERNPVTGRCVNPCKYGARGADGLCPKKPTGLAAGKLTKGQQALVRKAQTVAGNIAAKGAKGAITAVSTALAGMSGSAIAGALAAVVAAAGVGWFIGQDVRSALSGESKELRIEAANRNRRYAVAAMRDQLGRQPTLAEQAPITAAYKARLQAINQGGFQAL